MPMLAHRPPAGKACSVSAMPALRPFTPRQQPRSAVACSAAAAERTSPTSSSSSNSNGTGHHTHVPTKDWQAADGTVIKVMAQDYGFRTGGSRLYEEHYGEVPKGIFQLAFENFGTEWKNMRRMFVKDGFKPIFEAKEDKKANIFSKASIFFTKNVVRGLRKVDNVLVESNAFMSVDRLEFDDEFDMTPDEVRQKMKGLELDAHAVTQKERERFKAQPPNAPFFIKIPYFALCIILDLVYEGRPIQRFWVLEEVARMPYFAYLSMLHLYESLGWWRAGAALRKVHFAEEWNELHHLQIMESLGGDNAWIDRFVAQHSAIVYFWGVMVLYALSPKHAYQFSELVEGHATDTYEVFAAQNEKLLKELPPPRVAAEYYCGSDVYMFQSFLVSQEAQCRSPKCETLYDVFCNVIDDETEHKKTMIACQNPTEVARQIAEAKDVQCEV